MKFIDNIKKAFADVFAFNDLAGNLATASDARVDAQLGYIFEELCETIDGFEAGDRVEVLDGAADLFVTVSGLLQLLEAQGYDVATAIRRVNANNLDKFPAKASDNDRAKHFVSFNANYARYVLKDAGGKVKKPEGFSGVYLTDLIPTRVLDHTCTTVIQ